MKARSLDSQQQSVGTCVPTSVSPNLAMLSPAMRVVKSYALPHYLRKGSHSWLLDGVSLLANSMETLNHSLSDLQALLRNPESLQSLRLLKFSDLPYLQQCRGHRAAANVVMHALDPFAVAP